MPSARFLQAFQQGDLLTMKESAYRNWVLSFLTQLWKLDCGEKDWTTDLLFRRSAEQEKRTNIIAEIISNEEGVLAGMEELQAFASHQEISIKPCAKDGDSLAAGGTVAKLTGPPEKLLSLERIGLDLLGRLSGIATLTSRFIGQCREAGRVSLACTRKTLWGWLDKKGVYIGGGLTHRLGLWQGILVKDNHLKILKSLGNHSPVEEAIQRISQALGEKSPAFLEIEVETKQEALLLAETFSKKAKKTIPTAMLLDNFPPNEIREIARNLKERGLRDQIILEASGRIRKENLSNYARTGVDILSVGFLTHSAPLFDFTQRIVNVTQGFLKLI